MKSLDIEIAVMKYIGTRANLIVPNVSYGMDLHECDILSLSKSGYATEVEIKVSYSDLLKDKGKWHGHHDKKIAQLFFAVPELLEGRALNVIPERAGLFVARKEYEGLIEIVQVRACQRNENAVKWTDEERCKLARLGTLRILKLKKMIKNLQNQQLL